MPSNARIGDYLDQFRGFANDFRRQRGLPPYDDINRIKQEEFLRQIHEELARRAEEQRRQREAAAAAERAARVREELASRSRPPATAESRPALPPATAEDYTDRQRQLDAIQRGLQNRSQAQPVQSQPAQAQPSLLSQPEAAMRLGLRPDMLEEHLKTLPGPAVAQSRLHADQARALASLPKKTTPGSLPDGVRPIGAYDPRVHGSNTPKPIGTYDPRTASPSDVRLLGQSDDPMQKLRQMIQQEDQRRAALDTVQDAAVQRVMSGQRSNGPAPYGRNSRTFGFQQDLDTDDLYGGFSRDTQANIARHMRRGTATDAEVLGQQRRFPAVPAPGAPASPGARPQYDYAGLDQASADRTRAMWEKLGLVGEHAGDERSLDTIMGKSYGNRTMVSRGTTGGTLNPRSTVKLESGRARLADELARGDKGQRMDSDALRADMRADEQAGMLRAKARENMGLARALGLQTADTVTPDMVRDAMSDPEALALVRQKLDQQHAGFSKQTGDRRLAGAMVREMNPLIGSPAAREHLAQQAASRQAIGQGLAAMRQQQLLAGMDPEDRARLVQQQMQMAGQNADRWADMWKAQMGLMAAAREGQLDRDNAVKVAGIQAGNDQNKWSNAEWGYFSAVQDGTIQVSPAERTALEAEAKRQMGLKPGAVASPAGPPDPIQAATDLAQQAQRGGLMGALGLGADATAQDAYDAISAYTDKHGQFSTQHRDEIRQMLEKMKAAQGKDFNPSSSFSIVRQRAIQLMVNGVPPAEAIQQAKEEQKQRQMDAYRHRYDSTHPATGAGFFM